MKLANRNQLLKLPAKYLRWACPIDQYVALGAEQSLQTASAVQA
jgi:hypothetical protein